jgi:hypothetical protein
MRSTLVMGKLLVPFGRRCIHYICLDVGILYMACVACDTFV